MKAAVSPSMSPSMSPSVSLALLPVMLHIRDLSLGYPEQVLFSGLTMEIARGSTLAVLGANGAGKSTFVKMLLGVQEPLSGSLTWPGGKPAEIGYLAQMQAFDRRFPIRVRDLVAMGSWKGLGLFKRLDRTMRDKIHAALDLAGVADIADQSIHTLSGGQLQRALFARVIMQDAPLILLDEPFAAVDQTTEAHLRSLIDRWRDEGRSVVLVVHDLSSVLDHCSHALLLGGGEAGFGPVADILTAERLVAQKYLSPGQADWMFRSRSNNNMDPLVKGAA